MPQDIKNQFRHASILKDNRVTFNIGGNKYRLVVKINYPYRVAYIRFIGTHKQYDLRDDEPIYPPDPVEAIKFRMDQMGWTRKDLEPLLGGRSRVSEVLGQKRRLSLDMIRRLLAALAIPLESLLGTAA